MKLNRVKIPQTHKLKIRPKYFQAAAIGIKHFEIRKNYRDYKVGDQIELKEHDGSIFTGNNIKGEICYNSPANKKKDTLFSLLRNGRLLMARVG